MQVLFVHRAFPAQFGRLALELVNRYGWSCRFLVEHRSRCPSPTPEMLEKLPLFKLPLPSADPKSETPPWPQAFGQAMNIAEAVYNGAKALSGPKPDLIVGHGGLTPTLFLRQLYDCPIVDYCEYYFAPKRRDLTYRIDLPPVDPAHFFPRAINAPTLVNLTACDAGYSPTHWQRQSFPARFHQKIRVHFDGIDTELYRPHPVPRVIGNSAIAPQTRIVTYVARGLESVRGFDLFMQVARRVCQAYSDVLFIIAGDENIYYGWDKLRTGKQTFKDWSMSREDFDPSRFVFLGHVEPEELAEVLCLSDLHIYLSVPFVLSWSLMDALASGRVVLAGDVPGVREMIEPGKTGLLEPLFDIERLTEAALKVLNDPAEYRPLGEAARQVSEERYSLDVAVPKLKGFFEEIAEKRTSQRRPAAPAV